VILISILQLGRVDYATARDLQRRLVDLRKSGQVGDVLLLLEHPPVITLGRNAKSKNILAAPELLAQRHVEVHECDRGGDVTFHGPGQLVGYAIFDLRGLPSSDGKHKTLGAIEYVRRLENVLIRTCSDFGIAAKPIPGLTGVWTDRSEAAKIAAIGVHISRGVTSHGFALNVNTDLSYFDLIVPCGITACLVTSIEKELGRAVSLKDVAEKIAQNFAAVFSSDVAFVDSLDALLGPKLDIPARPPVELRRLHGEDDITWA
jgi:lipoyl(octanoyl) transferase